MQPQPSPDQIIARLKAAKDAGLKFEAAKQKLVSEGISETAIDDAADDFEYDASKPVSDIPKQVTDYFQAHPQQAMVDGTNLLKAKDQEDAKDARNQALLDSLAAGSASRFGAQGLDAQVEYESKFADDVGVPFWPMTAVQVIVNLGFLFVVYFLKWPKWTYSLNAVLTVALVAYLIKKAK